MPSPHTDQGLQTDTNIAAESHAVKAGARLANPMTQSNTLEGFKGTHGPYRVIGKNTGYINGEDVNVAIVGDYRDRELVPFNRDRWDADARLLASSYSLALFVQKVANIESADRAYFDTFFGTVRDEARSILSQITGEQA